MFIVMWIIKDILSDIEFRPQSLVEFTQYCQETLEKENKHELNNCFIFQQDYAGRTPLWWYTWDSFLCPMLNRALCLSQIGIIMKMGFFIRDLYQQINEMHRKQFCGTNGDQLFTVYRGQGMSKGDFQKVWNMKRGLIVVKNFLLTSPTEETAMKYVERVLLDSDKVGVIFIIKVKPSRSTGPFASINGLEADGNETDNVIFAMNTPFRIRNIKPVGRNTCLFRLKLELADENDDTLQVLTKRIREESFPDLQGWKRLGAALLKLKRPKDAEQVYKILLQQETEECNNAWLYNRLGWCKYEQAEYETAIRFCKKSIEIYETRSPDDPNLAMSCNNIGLVFDEMGEYTRALSYYEKALIIRQKSLPLNHPELESLYVNISFAYDEIGEYAKALSYKERILEIKQQPTPPNHRDLIGPCNSIGVSYLKMGNYEQAYSFFDKAVQHAEQSLPTNHIELRLLKNNRDRAKKEL
ncbi:unnamed protein product [Adineta ricciae]|uniref:Uncharacterized protein n=2 Tax=Adineta ricciae TaxID=249248 RepID=A0A815LUE9_ADIRI|nr:unnamed protein product [Adineta ricciae]